MKILKKRRNRWLGSGVLLGVLMLACAFHLLTWNNSQVASFNAGLQAYEDGNMQKAVQLSDRSLAAYKEGVTHDDWLHRHLYPQPDRALAARAAFMKAKSLLQLKQAPAALDAFKESLQLNPGNSYSDVTLEAAQRMERDALWVQYDLELLFKNNSQMAQQEGKGKGKGQGQPGNKQVPGTEPGNKPGKGNRDDI